MATDSEEFPADIKLCTEKVLVPAEEYSVSLKMESDLQTEVTGEIILQNVGEKELYFWELAFDTNACVENVWNARLSDDLPEGSAYLVKACDDTAIIAPGAEVRIGFNAAESDDVQTMIENISVFCSVSILWRYNNSRKKF